MKKLTFITVIILFILSSCYAPLEDSKVDSKKATTIEIQELPKDTVVISHNEETLFIFNKSNEVEYKVSLHEKKTVPISGAYFFFSQAILFALIILYIKYLFD